MNDKTKKMLKEQNEEIYNSLQNHFELPTFQDDIADDEVPSEFNYFLIVYGDFEPTETKRTLIQECYVVYVCEDNDLVDEQTIDVISTISNVKGLNFVGTQKRRLQKKDQDDYVDQVTIVFNRKVPYECKV
ncbi:hypothetical protein [Alkalihalobacterium alkalinitrilicum]|uniref:hypothetical protein n=1 Tax=Alkalihalobacterium alkalinitrilicum TaxID=427920 RepID=UPI000994CA39|nr:hypothetical protein [Alkalihalobacterium alkalinitrilicum]